MLKQFPVAYGESFAALLLFSCAIASDLLRARFLEPHLIGFTFGTFPNTIKALRHSFPMLVKVGPPL
jgi:hypothetical protein